MSFINILKKINQAIFSIDSVAKQKNHKKKTNLGYTEHQNIDPKNILKLIKKGYIIVGRSDLSELRKIYQSNPLDQTKIKMIGRITK